MRGFPESNGQQARVGPEHGVRDSVNCYGDYGRRQNFEPRDDSGSVARFFYCAKASRSERTCGGTVENRHPTVKPLALMRYLAKLTRTPTGGTMLDHFMGSGSTGCAAVLEGRRFIGCDNDEESYTIARQRIEATQNEYVQDAFLG